MEYKPTFKIMILITVLLLNGCGVKASIEQNVGKKYSEFEKKIENQTNLSYPDESYGGDTISYGILDAKGNPETDGVYHLKEGETFHRFINIANFIEQDMEYKLLVFDNYQQIDFEVDGDKTDNCDVYIEKNKDLQIPITLNFKEKGFHDVLFLIFYNAKSNLTKDERIDTWDFNTVYARCTIYVENADIPKYNLTNYDTIEPKEPVDIFVHKEKEEVNKIFLTESLGKNQPMTYYLTAGNSAEEDEECAILLLEDWKQKEIDGQSAIMTRIPAGHQFTIPVTTSYSKEGEHEITAVRISDIYKEYDYFSEGDVQSSSRVGVTVE